MVLVTVDHAGHQLDAAAAASLARAIGDGCPLDITSSYRSPDEQAHLIKLHADDPTRYAYAAPVAESNHPKGLALDAAGAMQTWLAAHGAGYGWVRNPREAWHYDYQQATDRHLPAPLSEEIDMLLIHHVVGNDQAYYVFDGRGLALVPPSPQYPDLAVLKATLRTVEAVGPTGLDPYRRVAQGLINSRP